MPAMHRAPAQTHCWELTLQRKGRTHGTIYKSGSRQQNIPGSAEREDSHHHDLRLCCIQECKSVFSNPARTNKIRYLPRTHVSPRGSLEVAAAETFPSWHTAIFMAFWVLAVTCCWLEDLSHSHSHSCSRSCCSSHNKLKAQLGFVSTGLCIRC